MILRGALVVVVLAAQVGALRAETEALAGATRAIAELEDAGAALRAAEQASDRVSALTRTVKAYETGLNALRDGLRQITVRESAIEAGFARDNARLGQLLGVMATLEQRPEAMLLMHPDGPVAAARSGMLMADVAPGLQAEVADLRLRLEEVRQIRTLQESAIGQLGAALQGIQQARADLSAAISNRTEPQAADSADAEALQALLESSDTMKAFAEGLAVLEQVAPPSAAATFQSAKGSLPLPVAGRILRGYDQPDAAGIKRPGLVLATEPGALMTAPWAATLRYVGPLLDYGNVMILEPAGDTLMVLAGMDQVYGAAGDIVQAGAPLGLMGGAIPSADAILADISDGSGAARTETLYLELRMAAKPVDPTDWFAETRD